MIWFATAERAEESELRMQVGILREVLPRVSETHPAIERLLAAAQNLVRAHEMRGPEGIAFAEWGAKQTVAEFARWRLGEAWDIHKGERAA
ncbi:MAG: hypothetical protein AAFR53_06235 [Pseudomonadota bacterium]